MRQKINKEVKKILLGRLDGIKQAISNLPNDIFGQRKEIRNIKARIITLKQYIKEV